MARDPRSWMSGQRTTKTLYRQISGLFSWLVVDTLSFAEIGLDFQDQLRFGSRFWPPLRPTARRLPLASPADPLLGAGCSKLRAKAGDSGRRSAHIPASLGSKGAFPNWTCALLFPTALEKNGKLIAAGQDLGSRETGPPAWCQTLASAQSRNDRPTNADRNRRRESRSRPASSAAREVGGLGRTKGQSEANRRPAPVAANTAVRDKNTSCRPPYPSRRPSRPLFCPAKAPASHPNQSQDDNKPIPRPRKGQTFFENLRAERLQSNLNTPILCLCANSSGVGVGLYLRGSTIPLRTQFSYFSCKRSMRPICSGDNEIGIFLPTVFWT